MIGILLAGCASNPFAPELPSQSAPPTPEVVRISYTPALRGYLGDLQECADRLPGLGLVVEEHAAPALDFVSADLSLRIGPAPDQSSYAAEIGLEQLVVVVHPENPQSLLSMDELRGIFSGLVTDWSVVGPSNQGIPLTSSQAIQPWTYLPGDDARSAFEFAVGLTGAPGLIHSAPDPEALREAVSSDPLAIGFLPSGWVDETLAVLKVSGLPETGFDVPVVSYSKEEPAGFSRQLLGCLSR